MPTIHLIERLNKLKLIDMDQHEWESGYWVVSEKTAQCLVGGDLYVHGGQREPSHFGGTILGYRVQQGGERDGRIIFRFQASMEHKGVKTDRKGWGNEKKVLGCEGETTRKRPAAHTVVHTAAHVAARAQATGETPEEG